MFTFPTTLHSPSVSMSGELWTPSEITTNLWLDASDSNTLTTGGGGSVSAWDDKSGSGNNVAQGTGSLQPTLNGDRIDFVNGEILTKATHTLLDSSGEHTIFYVHTIFDPTSSSHNFPNIMRIRSSASGVAARRPYLFYAKAADTFVHSFNNNNGSLVTASSFVGKSLITGLINSTPNNEMYINGTLESSVSTSLQTHTTSGLLTIGDLNAQNILFSFWEIIHVKGTMSSVDRLKTEGYLAWKHGLEGDLDVSHLYKSAAPTI